MSIASDSAETIEVVIIKLSTVTASDMLKHHVLSILALTFIQGHTDMNHENNKCLIISETIQAMPHQIYCEDSPTKGLYTILKSDDLAL